jgi:hypothetical protein
MIAFPHCFPTTGESVPGFCCAARIFIVSAPFPLSDDSTFLQGTLELSVFHLPSAMFPQTNFARYLPAVFRHVSRAIQQTPNTDSHAEESHVSDAVDFQLLRMQQRP